jgi:hypothetical protein
MILLKKKINASQNVPTLLGGIGFDLIETENKELCVELCREQCIGPGTVSLSKVFKY